MAFFALLAALLTACASYQIPGVSQARGTSSFSAVKTAQSGLVTYHGGRVQHHPIIYIVFWGFDGTRATDPAGTARYLTTFALGLSGDRYFDTLEQYYSGAQNHITDQAGEFAWSWYDAQKPAHNPDDAAVWSELQKALPNFTYSKDADYLVQAAHGVFSIDPRGTCGYHGVHDYSGRGPVHYIVMPYQPDFASACTFPVNAGGVNDGTSEVASSLIASTQANPDLTTGWFDQAGNEVGDLCAREGYAPDAFANVAFSTGTFPVEALWSNKYGGFCAFSYPP